MPKYTEDDNGFITFPDTPISKSGVFPYLGKSISPDLEPDKVYQVYRPESELNNPETIESFKLSPWISRHEMLGDKYTPAEDVGVEGVTGENVYFKNGALYANLKLFGESLKNAIKKGLKELSCGFSCLWVIQPGAAPDGTKYDVIQKRIRSNHLASVQKGRMGSDVSVAMDRATFALDQLDLTNPDGDNMTLEELIGLVKKLSKKVDTMSESMTGMSEDMKGMKEKAMDMEKKYEAGDMKGMKEKAMDMEKKYEAGDMDPEKDKDEDKVKQDEPSAMDAQELANVVEKAIKPLADKVTALESNTMDAGAVVKAIQQKNDLAEKASHIVGAFDHSEMDLQGVAKYALEKIGIACDDGQEVATLNGYLVDRKQPQFTVDNTAQDGADSAGLGKALDEAGL